MADAKRDGNYIPTVLALLESDGATPINIAADPSSHALEVDDNSSGSDNGPTPARALRDGNYVTTLVALSSAGDGALVPLYATADGKLLIDHT